MAEQIVDLIMAAFATGRAKGPARRSAARPESPVR